MVKGAFDERLYTKKEFENYLIKVCEEQEISVCYTVINGLNNEYSYGQRENQDAIQYKTVVLKNGYKVKIEIWGEEENVEIKDYEQLFMNYWNFEYSDKTTGFPTTEQTPMLKKCNNTLKYYHENNQKVALIMIDLDHFKEVNDNNNHDVGSRVLGEFAKLLFDSFADCGIMIHQTGDEFNIIFPYEQTVDLVNVIGTVKKARDKIDAHHFNDAPGINLSMAVGIRCIENEQLDFITVRNMAEETYNKNKRNTTKQRDSIRITGIKECAHGGIDLKLAWTRLICNLDGVISGNVYLEYIKQYVENKSEIKEIQKEIQNILDWINPEWDDSYMRNISQNIMMDTMEKFSKIELCLSIIQGLLKNSNLLENSIIFSVENNTLKIQMGENSLVTYKSDLPIDDFTGNCEDYYRRHYSKECKRILLVEVGYDDYPVEEELFCKVIHVDTRPITGGGLPDFWAATLCELISLTKDNPFVSDIIIYGNIHYCLGIIELLESIENWESDEKYNLNYISKKTFKSIEDIRQFKNKFQKHIFKCDNNTKLLNKVYQIYSTEAKEVNADNAFQSLCKQRILERNLSYDDLVLDICDGCRVKTIADAYPIVLEILRHQKQQKQYNIKDQAGRKLLELTDFKIVLTNPNSNELPDYYINDKQLLHEYYDNIFGKDEALFRKKLKEGKQLDALIKHVIQAINGKNHYATRRAVLVVPNVVEDEENYSPLGLISIWLAPRFIEEDVIIDFSYNWRTVEAVVGLPLSMYASVKFAEEIMARIKEEIKIYEHGIRMGAVSYIAHSLHMFLDTESMEIVRGIVNDASI